MTSRKTVFAGSAAARRRARRAHLQPFRPCATDAESLVMERPTPSKVEIQCKRRVNRVKRVLEPVCNEYSAQLAKQLEHYQQLRGQEARQNHRIWWRKPRSGTRSV